MLLSFNFKDLTYCFYSVTRGLQSLRGGLLPTGPLTLILIQGESCIAPAATSSRSADISAKGADDMIVCAYSLSSLYIQLACKKASSALMFREQYRGNEELEKNNVSPKEPF